ncbi:MAG: hypothetical protein KJP12_00855 [Acidimicrobiia bacterium]|nr:hypothetical protein [Acidimicrobiia bacterium]MBT8213742.1 hypothetical protein [Acidimicrobiia bacterium]NNF68385.1 hypothetical protein [Acidimicrobiia bacterium]
MSSHIVAYELAGRTMWAKVSAPSPQEILEVAPEVDVHDVPPVYMTDEAIRFVEQEPEMAVDQGLVDRIVDRWVGIEQRAS